MTYHLETELAERLLRINAIKLRPSQPFTWASGIKSPIYCDNRVTLTYPLVRNFIKEKFVEKSKEFGNFDVIAGVATAGIPHGALLADALDKPFIYIRSKPKGHGRENLIEGDIKGNENVLVIEDLISTGNSSIEACLNLREVGCNIAGVLAIFTYGFPVAIENFANANILLKTLSNYSVLLEEAVRTGYVNQEEYELLKDWKNDPLVWSQNNQ